MRAWSPTSRAAIAAILAGAVVLLLADAEYLRVISAVALLAGIVFGVFAIASPTALGGDPPPEERDPGA